VPISWVTLAGVPFVGAAQLVFASNHKNPGSDSQPKSGRRNIRRNLSPDVATFARTRQPLSRPVEDCEGSPRLLGLAI
jgi:hypothetical protein